MQPCQEDSRSFFEKLQNSKGLDLRDTRGKRHELAVVLIGVTLAILCNRDGNLSSIHRHMKNHHEKLMKALKIEGESVISRAQLPRVLENISHSLFDNLVFESYGVRLNPEQKRWLAMDGKDEKGSIETGAKRGEAVVQAVSHESMEVCGQNYYSGRKGSEVIAVRELLESNGLSKQKVTLDALHCKPKTLSLIAQSGGSYLVGLKGNQKELLNVVKDAIKDLPVLYQNGSVEKGHGRIQWRRYQVFDISSLEKDERWKSSELNTVVKVEREREEIKSEKKGNETSYYISNERAEFAELCVGIRNHWRVETNNHIRDVTLKEDKLRSKKRVYKEHWRGCEHW